MPSTLSLRGNQSSAVSARPVRSSASLRTAKFSRSSPPPVRVTPKAVISLWPAKKSRYSAGISGSSPPVKSASKRRPSSTARSATVPPAIRSPAASSEKVTSMLSSGPEPVSARSIDGSPSMPRSVATRPPWGSWRRTSRSSARLSFAKATARSSDPPGGSWRSIPRSASIAPSASCRLPVTPSWACSPKMLSSMASVEIESSETSMETGRSGSENGSARASGTGAVSGGTGWRRISTRSAPTLLTFTRPSRSDARRQSISAFSTRAQTPSSSETVIRPMVAVEDSRPETSWRRISRPGADSVFCSRLARNPFSLVSVSASDWASAAMATMSSGARMRPRRLKTPALSRCRARKANRRRAGRSAWRDRP